jgi:hypothetical protein
MNHLLLLRARSLIVTCHAINALMANELGSCHDIFTPHCLSITPTVTSPVRPEHFACPMVHPVTGETISSYKKLMNDPAMAETWQTAFGKYFGGMLQGSNKTGQKGMNAIFVMSHDEIQHVLNTGCKFSYGNLVVDYRPQKEDPHCIQITAGGNLITYASSLSIQTVDLDTAKLHWNSVISTKGMEYMCLDVKFFYLTTKLEYFKYMRMPLELFPIWIQEQYNLKMLAYKGFVHLEMRRAVWGLPQAGILTNKQLRCKLAPFGYYKHVSTPGLCYHKTRPILFRLVVNDFGVKYVNKEDIDHLIASIKTTYTLTKDWTGNLYCGFHLDWYYENQTVNISMPGYVKKKLQEYHHIVSKCIQFCPYMPAPKQFRSEAQSPLPPDLLPKLDKAGIKNIQKVVGSILYYARAINMTVLMALSTIAAEQMIAMERTLAKCTQMLDYLAHNATAKVRFHASYMIMNINSDASYLSESKACSRTCSHFFMGWQPANGKPIRINGAFHVSVNILRFVVASTAEAKVGALYHNCQTGIVFCWTIEAMGSNPKHLCIAIMQQRWALPITLLKNSV